MSWLHEFGFELAVCSWAERNWPPNGRRDRPILLARQLGTQGRRWDTVVIECSMEGLARRSAFGDRRLDSDLLHVVRNAPSEFAWYREALPDPGYPWRYVREAVHRAADRGAVETRRGTNGRIELRQTTPYPDWVHRIVAIENKPDLDATAAGALADQLERDVALALADEAWVATTATDELVEPVLLEQLPVEAGILVMDAEGAVSVTWQPSQLEVETARTRILERPTGTAHDRSAATFEYVDIEWKRRKRFEIAERAYERGWRSYVDRMRADCRYFHLHGPAEPFCTAKDRPQTAAECSGGCRSFEPEPPSWRQKGWPIDGGPGRAMRRVLSDQRSRRR